MPKTSFEYYENLILKRHPRKRHAWVITDSKKISYYLKNLMLFSVKVIFLGLKISPSIPYLL